MGRDYREGEGRGGERRSTCLPPRFDNPGYGPVRGGKGGRKGRKGKGRGEREGGRKGRTKGREGERDLAPPQKKILVPPLEQLLFMSSYPTFI